MRKSIIMLIVLLLVFSMSVFAKKTSIKVKVGAKSIYSGIGIGFFTGGENVLSLKKFLEKDNAVQVGLGWDWNGGYDVSFDYLFNNFDLIEINPGTVICYWGIGAQVGMGWYANNYIFGWGLNAALRVPFGVSYAFESVPVDITLQIVPEAGLLRGGFGIWPTGGLGARYYF